MCIDHVIKINMHIRVSVNRSMILALPITCMPFCFHSSNATTFNLFDFEHNRWSLFQKRAVSTRINIYHFLTSYIYSMYWAVYNVHVVTHFYEICICINSHTQYVIMNSITFRYASRLISGILDYKTIIDA